MILCFKIVLQKDNHISIEQQLLEMKGARGLARAMITDL